MRIAVWLVVCVTVVVGAFAGDAWAKGRARRPMSYGFVASPVAPVNPSEIGGSMFQAAAMTTTVLGWYQFDTPGGLPTTQGWTAHDMTAQVKSYWHVAGSPCAWLWSSVRSPGTPRRRGSHGQPRDSIMSGRRLR